MTNRRLVLAATLIVSSFAFSSAQTQPGLENLSWLSGCWEGRQSESLVEEHWSKPEGQSMLGFSRTLKDNKTVSYEFMQIREMAMGLEYVAQPQGGQKVSFKLVKSDNGKYVFENATHDFPQRIVYERQGAMMMTSIDGLLKGKQERQEFIMRRVRCNEPAN
jgi:Domain of unknown function (DUF6265)